MHRMTPFQKVALKVKYTFDVQCLNFQYKFVNNKLPNYFRDMFKYNRELHDNETRNHDPHISNSHQWCPWRLRHHKPDLLSKYLNIWYTELQRFVYLLFRTKLNAISLIYTVTNDSISIAMFATTENDKSHRQRLMSDDCHMISGCTCNSVRHSDKCGHGRWPECGRRYCVSV